MAVITRDLTTGTLPAGWSLTNDPTYPLLEQTTTYGIATINYPNNYPTTPNKNVAELIIDEPTALYIRINFADFYTEKNYDFVRLYVGTNLDFLVGQYSGNLGAWSLLIPASKIKLTFVSDVSVTFKGFSIPSVDILTDTTDLSSREDNFVVAQLPTTWYLNGDSLVFQPNVGVTSTNYPNNYDANVVGSVLCYAPDVVNGISLKFSAFDTEYNFDFVTISDIDSGEIFLKTSGVNADGFSTPFFYPQRGLKITFNSDKSQTRSGFAILSATILTDPTTDFNFVITHDLSTITQTNISNTFDTEVIVSSVATYSATFDSRATVSTAISKQFDTTTNLSTAISEVFDSLSSVATNVTILHDSAASISVNISGVFDSAASISTAITNLFDTLANVTTQTGYVASFDTQISVSTSKQLNFDSTITVATNLSTLFDSEAKISTLKTVSHDTLANVTTQTGYVAKFDTVVSVSNQITNIFDSVAGVSVQFSALFDSNVAVSTPVTVVFDSAAAVSNVYTKLFDSQLNVSTYLTQRFDILTAIANVISKQFDTNVRILDQSSEIEVKYYRTPITLSKTWETPIL